MELGETGVKSHRVVATFSKSPTGLDLPHRPHLVDALSQLVPDVLHKAEEKNENREIFREVDQTWEAGCWTCQRERERRRCHLQREAVPPECPWTGRRSRSRGRWQGSGWGTCFTDYKVPTNLGWEKAVVDRTEPVRWAVLQSSVLSSEEEPATDLRRSRDHREEHAGQVEVPEVAGDLHAVVEEGDDGDGEVEGAPDVVALLHVRLVHCGDNQGVSTTSPEVGTLGKIS